jgi:hypothetical protein
MNSATRSHRCATAWKSCGASPTPPARPRPCTR